MTCARGALYLVYFPTYYMTMIKLNIHEAKTHLSRHLARLERGEKIILCKRNVPIAEIIPLAKADSSPRPIGLARGEFAVSREFFAPLPQEIRDGFEGRGG